VMKLLVVLLIASLAICSVVAQQRGKWLQGARAQGDARVEFMIATNYNQEGLEQLKEALFDVSDPKSVNYGKHWSQDEIRAVIGPDSDRVQRIEMWLRSVGPVETERLEKGAFLIVKTIAKVAERLFKVELYEYVHVDNGSRRLRSPSMYQLPESISSDIELVTGIFDLPIYNRLENKPKPVMRADKKGNAPETQLAFTSTTQLFAEFIPLCSNGKPTNSTTNLCSDQGSSITQFNFQYKTGPNDNFVKNVTLNFPSPSVICTNEGEIVCTAVVEPVPSFELLELSVQSVYSNSNVSAWGTFAYRIAPNSLVTPDLLRKHYGVPSSAGLIPHQKNLQGVAEFSGQYYSPNDQIAFARLMGLPKTNVTLVGYNNASNPGIESTLDIQWISAMAPGIPAVFWSSPGFILDWVAILNNDTHPPFVNSVSYGAAEDEFLREYPPLYMQRCDTEFMKLGVRGVTIVIAAGDAGTTNVGHGGYKCTPLHPNYPSSSPYVLSVSATMLTPKTSGVCYTDIYGGLSKIECTALGEIAMDAELGFFWTTGGGFSSRTPRQTWQTDAVNNFFAQVSEKVLPPQNIWNQNGRGYPDVSACGHNVLVVYGDIIMPVDGTSAAAPIFAGILTLINNDRFHNGKPSLGYINPALYAYYKTNPSVVNDVVFGSNNDGSYVPGGILDYHCPYGFNSTIGWDPVSGLGTPNYPELYQAFK